jgi:hypothetical protein
MTAGVRGVTTAYSATSTISGTIPAATQAGDTLVMYCGGAWSSTLPAGWTTLNVLTGTNFNGLTAYRTAVAGDAGSTLTVSLAGSSGQELAIVAVTGSYASPVAFGIRDSSLTANTVTATSTSVNGLLLWLGSARVTSSTISLSRTVTVEGTRTGDTNACLYVASETAAGGSAAGTFTPSPLGSGGSYYAVVAFTLLVPTLSGGGQLSTVVPVTAAPLSGGGQLSTKAAVTAALSGGGDATIGSLTDTTDSPGPVAPDPPATVTDPPVDTQPDPGADPEDPVQVPDPLIPAPVILDVMRVSHTYPAPTLSRGMPSDWTPTATVTEAWGHWRIYVAGVDRTLFRGSPTQIGSYTLAEPFGAGPATLILPRVTPWDAPGSGALAWLKPGEPVVLARVRPTGAVEGRWWGVIGSEDPELDESQWTYQVALVGEAWVGDLQTCKPPTYLPPTDIGTVIPDTLNAVVSRRIGKVPRVTTGILTNQRGASDQGVLEYAQSLLATATTDDGSNQWTLARPALNSPGLVMRLKDKTTVAWSVRAGQPGVSVRISRDATQAPNRIYGRGVATTGYAWANWKYPNAGTDQAPAYPFSGAGHVITVGTTDADTSTGDGVSTWQQRVNDLNLTKNVPVDGVYNSSDAAVCRDIQDHYGLAVDGVVGPQTWAATFDVGANGTSLTGAFRLPLAWDPKVMPRLYHADGSDAGANSAYDSTLLVVDRDENFGSGISKVDGIRSAKAELARDRTPGWAGSITLTMDPPEGARWDIREGQNVKLKGWFGRDVVLHIAQVAVNVADGSVSLTVDEKARDLATLGSIISRNREAKDDPARLPTRRLRRSKLNPDAIVEFDGESAGGVIPRHALYGGLWTVIRIPVSQAGQVAKVTMTTTTPASPFCVAFFGDQVTPADLIHLVGADPLTSDGTGYGPFDRNYNALLDYGFVEAIGGPGQAAGYDPGYQTSPYTGDSTVLTGKMVSTASWSYRSSKPPWLWLAEFSPTSCFISGRIFPAPVDL